MPRNNKKTQIAIAKVHDQLAKVQDGRKSFLTRAEIDALYEDQNVEIIKALDKGISQEALLTMSNKQLETIDKVQKQRQAVEKIRVEMKNTAVAESQLDWGLELSEKIIPEKKRLSEKASELADDKIAWLNETIDKIKKSEDVMEPETEERIKTLYMQKDEALLTAIAASKEYESSILKFLQSPVAKQANQTINIAASASTNSEGKGQDVNTKVVETSSKPKDSPSSDLANKIGGLLGD